MALDAQGRVIPNAPQTGWRIEGQQETTELDSSGRVVNGVRVMFVTASGQHGSVFVARSAYSIPNVQAAVANAAGTMEAVARLTG